ncbi:MAG: recombinase family protein [Patescibacteria group bacterium]
MKAVIWNRVSTREQEQGYSLEAQAKGNGEYAKRTGFDDIKSFSVSESASKSEQRKIFDQMMQYANEHGVKDIISEKVDRFTRRIKEAAAIHDWLIEDGQRQLHFVKESLVINRDSKSHEKFLLNMKVAVAQFYADNLSEEVKKGQQGKIESGWYPFVSIVSC